MAVMDPFEFLYGAERARYIRNNNPFGRNVNVGGQMVAVAPTFGDLQSSQRWISNYLARNPVNPAGGQGGQYPGNPGVNLAGGRATQSLDANPFQTVSNVKNPGIQAAIDAALASVNASSLVPGQQTQAVTRSVRSPRLQTAIDAGIDRVQADATNNAQSVDEFTKQFLAEQRAARDRATAESGAIDRVFDPGAGGVQATLNNMSESQALNETQAASRAMQRARGASNSARISGGDSSYNDALLARALGDIGTQGAIRRGDRDLTNYRNVLGLQAALPGVSQGVIDNAIRRMLVPTQARQTVAAGDLQNLSQIGNLEQSNSFFNLDTQDQALARRLELLRGVAGLDQSNTFYGLRSPYEPDTGGRLPIRLPPGRQPDYPFYPDQGPPSGGLPPDPTVRPPSYIPRPYTPPPNNNYPGVGYIGDGAGTYDFFGNQDVLNSQALFDLYPQIFGNRRMVTPEERLQFE